MGALVKAGDPLIDLYSADAFALQGELAAAVKLGDRPLITALTQRLERLNLGHVARAILNGGAPVDTFTYYGEGWGLTTDGTSIIMSDGSARLRFLDPKTFTVQRTIDVHDGTSPVSQLNELEWYKGEILANVWQSMQIARIDPQTGAITGWIDLTGILAPQDKNGTEDVLNGIAYDAATDKLYVTGKNYSKLYQIALKPR